MTARAAASTGRRERPASPELRRDVRLLTTMLGDAIAESGGPTLLAEVEALRTRDDRVPGTPTAARRRHDRLPRGSARSSTRAEDVIRAFTCYFQLVNLAEERQRLRVLARRARSGKPVKDSIDALDVDASAFEDLRITPVLTAHPTEAKRRAVVEHLWRIGALLEQLEDLPTGAADEQEIASPAARGDRRAVAHRADPPAPSRAARRGARDARAVRPDDLRDPAGDLSRGGPHPRPRRLWSAAAVVRAVPPMGHLGGRRSRRQPRASPPRSRVPRWRSSPTMCCAGWRRRPAGSPGPCRCPSATCRRAARSPGAWIATRASFPRSPPNSAGRCPTRRTGASSGSRRIGSPRPAPGTRGAYDRAGGVPHGHRRRCSAPSRPAARRGWRGASCNTCAGRWRRSGSIWPRWRCGSTRACWRPPARRSRRRARPGPRRRRARCWRPSGRSRTSSSDWDPRRASASS